MPTKLDKLVEDVVAGVASNGRVHRKSARAKAILGPAKRKIAPRWTPEELVFLESNLGVLPLRTIAHKLKRSPVAVKVKYTRKGYTPASKHRDYYSRSAVAQILGIDVHQVMQWNTLGLLKFSRVPGMERCINERMWVHSSKFRRFVLNPYNFPYFRYTQEKTRRKIPHAGYAKLIKMLEKIWPDEWWTTAQAAIHFGLKSTGPINKRIRAGTLPAKRWGNWYVLRSEALKLTVRAGSGMSTGKKK